MLCAAPGASCWRSWSALGAICSRSSAYVGSPGCAYNALNDRNADNALKDPNCPKPSPNCSLGLTFLRLYCPCRSHVLSFMVFAMFCYAFAMFCCVFAMSCYVFAMTQVHSGPQLGRAHPPLDPRSCPGHLAPDGGEDAWCCRGGQTQTVQGRRPGTSQSGYQAAMEKLSDSFGLRSEAELTFLSDFKMLTPDMLVPCL